MKSAKSHLDEFRREGRDERTDRIAKELVQTDAEERIEKTRLLRRARLERAATHATQANDATGPDEDGNEPGSTA